MKKFGLTVCIFFSVITVYAQDSFIGIWDTGKENTKIEITRENGVYFGAIHSSDREEAKIGAQLLKDVKLDNNEWKGRLYNAKKEKWYDAKLEIKDGELHIRVKAGIAGKTVKWKRVED
jgi:uncharacterized protein (DUF2147 family)